MRQCSRMTPERDTADTLPGRPELMADGWLERLLRDDPKATAQDAFARFVTHDLASRLMPLGFRKGSGNGFIRPDDRYWFIVGVQRSRSSTDAKVLFTINVTATSKDVWDAVRAEEPWLPRRPSANTFVGSPIKQWRIGDLLSTREDRWWEVRPTTNTAGLADEIAAIVARTVVPAMEAARDS